MTTNQHDFTKVAKGRYRATVEGTAFILFRDAYTGLWRIRYEEGGSPDWAGPFKTKNEAQGYFWRRMA